MEITKQDWKLFQKKIVFWQEAYMERLNREYIDILMSDGNPSDRFWRLEQRINRDKKSRGVLIQMRKQTVIFDLAALIHEGVITITDIDEFSDELKNAVMYLCGNNYKLE